MKKGAILYISYVLALACLVTLLSGCSIPIVNEAKLTEDLCHSQVFQENSSMLGLEISSLSIVKRKTTQNEKDDQVWVCVDATNGEVNARMYYLMVYTLYNDGWLLEYATTDSVDLWMYTPLCRLSDEIVRSYIPTDAEIKSVQFDADTGRQDVSYRYVEPYHYCDVITDAVIHFSFGSTYFGQGLWSNEGTDITVSTEWGDITGSWYGEKYSTNLNKVVEKAHVEILKFVPDSTGDTIDIEVAVTDNAVDGVFYSEWETEQFHGTYTMEKRKDTWEDKEYYTVCLNNQTALIGDRISLNIAYDYIILDADRPFRMQNKIELSKSSN